MRMASDKKQTSQQQICPKCGVSNRVGLVFCENCGTNLHTGEGPRIETQVFDDESTLTADDDPAIETLREKDVVKPVATGASAFSADTELWLELERWKAPLKFRLQPGNIITLGRRDPESGLSLTVDLAPYGAYPLGVSRRHVRIHFVDDHLELEDLESANGTYVNETRLAPGQSVVLHDGDEVRLARFVIRVYFET